MELLLAFLGGYVLANITTYRLLKERIDDYKQFSDTRIEDYKDSFSKGYQTNNGTKPYLNENETLDIYKVNDDFEYDLATYKKERWDD